jgi:hypothetical protein
MQAEPHCRCAYPASAAPTASRLLAPFGEDHVERILLRHEIVAIDGAERWIGSVHKGEDLTDAAREPALPTGPQCAAFWDTRDLMHEHRRCRRQPSLSAQASIERNCALSAAFSCSRSNR